MNTNVCDGEIEKERQDRLVELEARWRLGDKSAAEQLTRELYPMVKACAVRAGRHRVDDEALSEATFAMLNAARRYDPARKVPFTRYVWRIATGALGTSCRTEGRYAARLSTPAAADDDGTDGPDAADARPDARDDIHRVDMRMDIEMALGQLTPMERRVIEMQYFEGLRQKEVAKVLGTSQPSVSHTARRALKKMRAYFERTGSVEGEAERSGR